jgi:hypothetical protein
MQAPSLRITLEAWEREQLERTYALPARDPDHGLE